MKVAMVTGAGSGIGRTTARLLATRGYAVVCADLDHNAAAETAAAVDDAIGVQLDVRDTASVTRAVDEVARTRGAVDLLVNNAGVGSTQVLADTEPRTWDLVFDVNVGGVYRCCRAILPSMLERGHGVIVNVASVAGLVGLRSRAAYCASKGAVISLTRAMAIDHVGDGIRVNCVCPGTVDSPWVARLLDEAPDPATAREQLTARQPMGRLGRPDEVAAAIAYLASDEAAFMTGTALVIDGGLTAA
jgi:meso-butanediol dehydrogenase / (S,S)-butanediol dehydrogenase / diacetyl reductase